MPLIHFEVRNLHKIFHDASKAQGGLEVLRGVNMALAKGDFEVIVGRSGCGKTTLLRVLAGLEGYDGGELLFSGNRRIGMVFQEPRLMPWLSVYDNVAFGAPNVPRERILELISAVRLQGFEAMKPAQLSGGMKHRAALARALALNPQVLLMDEPFAALDYFTRMAMQNLLIELYQREKVTVVFVTHSIDEAVVLGRRASVMAGGRIVKSYDLSDYAYPRDLSNPALAAIKREILENIMEPCQGSCGNCN